MERQKAEQERQLQREAEREAEHRRRIEEERLQVCSGNHSSIFSIYCLIVVGAHNPKGRSVKLVILPVVKWHLHNSSLYGMTSWLVNCATSATCTYRIRTCGLVLFDNRWNQHTYRSLMLLPFGIWAPGWGNYNFIKTMLFIVFMFLCSY